MNLLDELFSLFSINEVYVSERTSILGASFKISKDYIPIYSCIKKVLNKFPSRDIITITFSDILDNFCRVSSLENNEEKFLSFVQELEDEDEVDVKVSIEKTISNNILSVYNFNSFSKELLSGNLVNMIDRFSYILKQTPYVVFEMFDNQQSFSSETMVFRSYSPSKTIFDFDRQSKLNSCKAGAYFYGIEEYPLLPEDFHLNCTYEGNPFNECFSKIETIFSLAYISNSANILNNAFNIQICGQRNFSISYDLSNGDMITHCKELYSIYKWIYTDGNVIDKAILARNVISLHCKFVDLLALDDTTLSSIKSNYAMYLKNNIEQYIEVKNKVSDYIFDFCNRIGEVVVTVIHKFRNNVIAIFTFLLTVFFTNLASTDIMANIFSSEVKFVINIIIVGSIIYLGLSVYEIIITMSIQKEAYEKLKNTYGDLLDDKDQKEIFKEDKFINTKIKSTWKQVWVLIAIWVIVLLMLGIIFNFKIIQKTNISNKNFQNNSITTITQIQIEKQEP